MPNLDTVSTSYIEAMPNREISDAVDSVDLLHGSTDTLNMPLIDMDSTSVVDSISNVLPRQLEQVEVEQIFGTESVLVSPQGLIDTMHTQTWLLTDNIYFRIFVVLFFLGLCLLFYFNKGQIVALFNTLRGKNYFEQAISEQNYLFDRFVNMSIVVGFLTTGIVVARVVDILFAHQLTGFLPSWLMLISVPILCLVTAFIFSVQMGIMGISGVIVDQTAIMADVIRTKKLFFAMSAVIGAPIVLLLSLSVGTPAQVLLYTYFGLMSILLILFLRGTIVLFVDNKISIFYWFLYLCGIEVFPISFLVFLALRYLG